LQFKNLNLEEKIKKFDADLWEKIEDMTLPDNEYDLFVKMHEIGDSEYVSRLYVLYSTGDDYDERRISEFYDKNAKRIVEIETITTPGDNWTVQTAMIWAMRDKKMGPFRWTAPDYTDIYPFSTDPVVHADYPGTYKNELIQEIKNLQPEQVEKWIH